MPIRIVPTNPMFGKPIRKPKPKSKPTRKPKSKGVKPSKKLSRSSKGKHKYRKGNYIRKA